MVFHLSYPLNNSAIYRGNKNINPRSQTMVRSPLLQGEPRKKQRVIYFPFPRDWILNPGWLFHDGIQMVYGLMVYEISKIPILNG